MRTSNFSQIGAEPAAAALTFPPFRLDPDAALLMCGERVIELRPKAFALLKHLASNPGILLTKDALLASIWPNRIVSEAGLTELVRELRKALDDDARTPRFIETVHGRGYRFIASPHPSGAMAVPREVPDDASPRVPFVGREPELRSLQHALVRASKGIRQLVFITGEPGIGKTSLLDAFRRSVALAGNASADAAPWVVRGQCIEQYGAGEAYLPILDALSRLARVAGHELIEILRRYAPTWLAQLPALREAPEVADLALPVLGTTRERMLREMAEALEAITLAHPLVLMLEDLHWSDYSTLDLLSFVAQREEPARLMILATYRPAEVHAREHPFRGVKQELQARAQCVELPLPCLSQEAVKEYLGIRLGDAPAVPDAGLLAPVVHRRTEGHPLFMVNVVDFVAAQAFCGLPESVERSIPDSVRQMIEKQMDRLSRDEQALLEAASVAGVEFSAASVAAALGVPDIDAIEQGCAALARRAQFLLARGSAHWPDGTVAGRFAFIHALYHNVFYYRIPPGRRARLHLRVGVREEAGYASQASDIAGGLALHFEEGRDFERALQYLLLAGGKAVQRCANREAIELFTRGLSLLAYLPDSSRRLRSELALRLALGPPLIHSHGYAADIVERTYARARALQEEVGESSQLLSILWGQWLYFVVRGEHAVAVDIGIELQRLERQQDLNFPWAHYAVGCSMFWLGNAEESTQALEHGLARYAVETHAGMVSAFSQDPKTVCLLYRGWDEWLLGRPDQALASCVTAARWAESLAHPFSLAFAIDYSAVVLFLRREPELVRERAVLAMTLSAEHDFPFWHAWADMMLGWADAVGAGSADGIGRLRNGLVAYEATGARMGKSLFLLMLADACSTIGASQEGLDAVAEAIAFCGASKEHAFLPELYRLEGELILAAGAHHAIPEATAVLRAAACFARALELAHAQGALGWALRAAASLARLWLNQGRPADARDALSPVYAAFNEGFETHDLRVAGMLLAKLAR